MYEEVIAISQRVSRLIEARRVSETETMSEILERELGGGPDGRAVGGSVPPQGGLDLGQGVRLPAGEHLYLFLSVEAKKRGAPDAIAEVVKDGLYLDGKEVAPSRGSLIHPAMQIVQRRIGNVGADGRPVSLSAWRQWHVRRERDYVPLFELKDPTLARRRRRFNLMDF
jgi:hypothetical protein